MYKSARSQHGMLMLECVISLLIFTIGVLGMVKMQALASANSVNSEDRATAAVLANDLISEMWTNASTTIPTADFNAWNGRVGKALQNGVGVAQVDATDTTKITVTITWLPRGRASTDSVQNATYETQVFIQ